MLQLKLNGKLFGGWTEATITRGIDQLASTFDLRVTDRWDNVKWSIKPFDSCELLWKSQPILTGYIDVNSISYDAESHDIAISGRSKTADLVDCSASSAQFNNQTFKQIAVALCKPFGITVNAQVSTGKQFITWKPDEGVQVFEALEKLARLRGLLLMDDGAGQLVITQAGTKRITTPLKLGKNIKAAGGQFNVKDRFSDYIVKGQQKGGDNISPEFAAHVTATVKDTLVPRYRPMLLQAEDQTDTATAQNRAQWENNVRFGQSQSFNYTVQGWEHKTGLWQPNQIVHVKDSLMGLDIDLLIKSVSYSLSSNGSITQLELAHPQAFLTEPLKPVIKKTGNKKESSIVWNELTP